MLNTKEAKSVLDFLKNESINDIATLKNSLITKTLYQLYFANFDVLDDFIKEIESFNKILQIVKDGEFYDKFGNCYDSPTLYYDNGWIIQDAFTEKDFNIEDYGKTFARYESEIQ